MKLTAMGQYHLTMNGTAEDETKAESVICDLIPNVQNKLPACVQTHAVWLSNKETDIHVWVMESIFQNHTNILMILKNMCENV